MKAIAKYAWIAHTTARSHFAYAGEVLARLLFMTVILFIFSRVWLAAYSGEGAKTLAGLTFEQMIWYLVATEAFVISAPRTWAEVEQDVRSGALAVKLIHPLSYIAAHLARAAGERVARFGMYLLAGAIVATVIVGPIRWTSAGILMFVAILPVAWLLDFLGHFLVGLCAFWMESINGIALIYTRAVVLLGGVLLPLEIYPESLQQVVRSLPFASMVYAPARLFVDPQTAVFQAAIVSQLAALMVMAGVVAVVHRAALRRVFTNGG